MKIGMPVINILVSVFAKKKKKSPDRPGKLAQCIPIYGTILGQCTRNRANAGPTFMVCRARMDLILRLNSTFVVYPRSHKMY